MTPDNYSLGHDGVRVLPAPPEGGTADRRDGDGHGGRGRG
jgi:hypothetical protein